MLIYLFLQEFQQCSRKIYIYRRTLISIKTISLSFLSLALHKHLSFIILPPDYPVCWRPLPSSKRPVQITSRGRFKHNLCRYFRVTGYSKSKLEFASQYLDDLAFFILQVKAPATTRRTSQVFTPGFPDTNIPISGESLIVLYIVSDYIHFDDVSIVFIGLHLFAGDILFLVILLEDLAFKISRINNVGSFSISISYSIF